MFHGKRLNNKINRINDRALRIAHKNYPSTFNILVETNCTVNMHIKSLQTLMTEMLKTTENVNPPFMKEIICKHSVIYNLRNNNDFLPPTVRAVS